MATGGVAASTDIVKSITCGTFNSSVRGTLIYMNASPFFCIYTVLQLWRPLCCFFFTFYVYLRKKNTLKLYKQFYMRKLFTRNDFWRIFVNLTFLKQKSRENVPKHPSHLITWNIKNSQEINQQKASPDSSDGVTSFARVQSADGGCCNKALLTLYLGINTVLRLNMYIIHLVHCKCICNWNC